MPGAADGREAILPALAEVFREHGFAGASLTRISRATGLGKGSLYHYFPGGKAEMAAAVLSQIDAWFEQHVFAPLRAHPAPLAGVDHMLEAVDGYFGSGRRVCLVGAFALGDARDAFARELRVYFQRWVAALCAALMRCGLGRSTASALAEESVGALQGALVLTRALEDRQVFVRALRRLRARLHAHAAGRGALSVARS